VPRRSLTASGTLRDGARECYGPRITTQHFSWSFGFYSWAFRALLAGFALTACSAKGAVALSAYAQSPSLQVESVLLGSSLGGGFELVLQQGMAAPDATSVSLGSVGLKDGAGVILDSLPLSVSPQFPVEVAVGGSQIVRFSLDESQLVEATTAERLCAAGAKPYFFGTVTDSASGNLTPFQSDPFVVDCL
jgi:hypothetical protein